MCNRKCPQGKDSSREKPPDGTMAKRVGVKGTKKRLNELKVSRQKEDNRRWKGSEKGKGEEPWKERRSESDVLSELGSLAWVGLRENPKDCKGQGREVVCYCWRPARNGKEMRKS